ncbi:MAG: lipopolysaccharide assembly protein LapA domain-containing protein [Solirubrobacteraceae bacterium]
MQGRADSHERRTQERCRRGDRSLILLLIFILENTQQVKISYLGATGHLALGIALLLAAAAGALLTALIGGARILQLRRRIKQHPS